MVYFSLLSVLPAIHMVTFTWGWHGFHWGQTIWWNLRVINSFIMMHLDVYDSRKINNHKAFLVFKTLTHWFENHIKYSTSTGMYDMGLIALFNYSMWDVCYLLLQDAFDIDILPVHFIMLFVTKATWGSHYIIFCISNMCTCYITNILILPKGV